MEITINQTVKVYDVVVNQIARTINVNIVNQPKQTTVTISPLGQRGFQGEQGIQGGLITKTAGENINSHTPVVLINDLAYKLDSSNPLHQFAFVGFTEASSLMNEDCNIKQIGEIYLGGWGLMPNQQYLAGVNGTLITENLSSSNFTKVVGYATNSDTLQIIKDSITINKS
jgi:hypothetical protein